jgi:hypothetical protein
MGFMRRVRLSRSGADSDTATGAAGLDAFGTEETLAEAPATDAAKGSQQARIAIAVLTALVLIEAVPAALWLRARLRPPVVAEPVAAAALPAAAAIPLASCDSTPAPAPAAPAPVTSAAATTGVAKGAAASGGKTDAVPAVTPPVEKSMLAGSVAVTAPVPMQVLLKGRVVATTEAESFMLPVGTQELEFVNQNVGFRARRTVTIQAGKTTTVRLDPPTGTVNVNAVPWAEVWMNGQRLGETPLGNLQLPIGTRELIFRHPEFGERRATVLVTLKEPARISMDLRKK